MLTACDVAKSQNREDIAVLINKVNINSLLN